MPERAFHGTPVAVAALAGLIDGVMGSPMTAKLGPARGGVTKWTLFGAGLAGHLLGWSEDVSYALMTCGAWALASQVPWAVYTKNPEYLYDIAPAQRAPVTPR